MAIRVLIYLSFVMLVGCVGEPRVNAGDGRIIKIGDHATMYDLVHVVGEWNLVRSAIVQGDDRLCVKNNLSIESLVFIDLEPADRLAIYNPHYADKLISEGLKIYRLGFFDPCGGRTEYATDPHWILVEGQQGFELLSFFQVME